MAGPSDGDPRVVSSTVPDWSRERPGRWWDPSRQLLRSIRRYQSWRSRTGPGRLLARYWVLSHRFWSVVTGADIPLNSRIGGGLLLPHPNGIVVHPDVVIGPNCLLFQQVTLGAGGPKPGLPRLGGHVDIGAGARVLGGVTIGDHARVGANSVVLDDIPPGATAVGIPARVIAPRTARAEPEPNPTEPSPPGSPRRADRSESRQAEPDDGDGQPRQVECQGR